MFPPKAGPPYISSTFADEIARFPCPFGDFKKMETKPLLETHEGAEAKPALKRRTPKTRKSPPGREAEEGRKRKKSRVGFGAAQEMMMMSTSRVMDAHDPQDEDEDEDEDDQGGVFINQTDVLEEINIDEEDWDGDGDDEGGQGGQDFGDMEFGEKEGGPEVNDYVHTFSGHKGPVYSVAFNPTDSGLVATGGGDDIAFLWRVGDGESHRQLQGHTDSVGSLAFSTDGELLASGGFDGVVNVWECSTGSLKHKLEGPGEAIEWVKWHPWGHLVLAGSEDLTAWLWNGDSGACMAVLSGHSGKVTCGDFTPEGKTICTGSEDGSFRVWNPKSSQSTRVVQGHPFHTEGLTCISIANDSSIAITGSTDTNACLVNVHVGKVVGSLTEHSRSVECVGFSSVLPLAATGAMDGKLIIWDLQTLSARSTCEHEDGVVKLKWSPAAQLIYTGCLDGKVRVWDDRTGHCVRTFQGHDDRIQDIAVSRNGNIILSCADDNTARVFEM